MNDLSTSAVSNSNDGFTKQTASKKNGCSSCVLRESKVHIREFERVSFKKRKFKNNNFELLKGRLTAVL